MLQTFEPRLPVTLTKNYMEMNDIFLKFDSYILQLKNVLPVHQIKK